MDHRVFYETIRREPRLGISSLTQKQVDNIEAILARGDGLRRDALAYALATAWGESRFEPTRENMTYTSASRIRSVWPSRFRSDDAAKPYVRNPQGLANFVYGGRADLGNRPGTDDGWRYRGGGLVQLTGRNHYLRLGIADTPERILEPDLSARALVSGMVLGSFTGKKLADYFGEDRDRDFEGARAIVNGDVRANGAKYGTYGRAFADALEAAGYPEPGYDEALPVPDVFDKGTPPEKPAEAPQTPASPDPAPTTVPVLELPPAPAQRPAGGSPIATFFRWLADVFDKRN